ncbi:MAG: LLM class flavin-dependent oxidoreductase [Mycobacterium sp.]|nr:LLM class flavin-dependent oxidoreductase [Mycobacterium sp.]
MPDDEVDTEEAVPRLVRVGCMFRPENPPETIAAAARTADEVGLDELWVCEDCFFNGGLSVAAVALANSSRLLIGVGVLPAPLRNVACTAMEIATLDRAYPGRLRIGIGHGVQDWMGQVGAKVASPLTLLREYTTALSTLLRGGSVTCAGRYVTLTNVRLDWPPVTDVNVLLAATGPKTLRLSGQVATGTIIDSCTSPDVLRDAVSIIRQGSGPGADRRHQVVSYVASAIDDDAYRSIEREGKARRGDFSSDLVTYGSPERIAHGARRWIAAGADTIVFHPPAGIDIRAFIDTIGSGVQPLLHEGRGEAVQ